MYFAVLPQFAGDTAEKMKRQGNSIVPWRPQGHEISPLTNFSPEKNIGIPMGISSGDGRVKGKRKAKDTEYIGSSVCGPHSKSPLPTIFHC